MSLPPGARLLERVGGGDLNQAFHVILADGSEAFVKTRQDPAPGEYAAEAAALQWLAEPGALSTPQVLACEPDYLALEWIEPAPSARLDRDREEQLGRGSRSPTRQARHASAIRIPIIPAGSPRCASQTRPRPTGPPSTPSGGSHRLRGSPSSRVSSHPPRWPPSSMSVSESAQSPGRPSRPRACTAICGPATSWPAPTGVPG